MQVIYDFFTRTNDRKRETVEEHRKRITKEICEQLKAYKGKPVLISNYWNHCLGRVEEFDFKHTRAGYLYVGGDDGQWRSCLESIYVLRCFIDDNDVMHIEQHGQGVKIIPAKIESKVALEGEIADLAGKLTQFVGKPVNVEQYDDNKVERIDLPKFDFNIRSGSLISIWGNDQRKPIRWINVNSIQQITYRTTHTERIYIETPSNYFIISLAK